MFLYKFTDAFSPSTRTLAVADGSRGRRCSRFGSRLLSPGWNNWD